MTRFLIEPHEMDLETAEAIVGEPAAQWEGRCYEIAGLIADNMKHAQAVYGHYVGPVDPDGHWGSQAHIGFIQHGWVIFKKHKRIMDPTRWSFENVDPYIYYDKPQQQYDEGGNDFRSPSNYRPCPSFDHTKGIVKFEEATSYSALARHLNCLLPSIRLEREVRIDKKQAFWLANVHYCRLEPFVKEIYLGLEAAGCKAFIPFDNWKRAFRQW